MSGETPTGQDTPAITGEVTTPEAAPVNAAPTEATTQGAEAEVSTAAEKTFTQQELDAIIQKEKAKAEAKAERRVLRTLEKFQPTQAQQPVQQPTDDRPRRDQFASEDDYFDKLTDWKLEQRDRGQRQQAQQRYVQTVAEKTERIYAEAEKVPGFDREEFDALPLTPVLASAITESDVAPKLMAHLSAHPEEVARIASLSPARQAAEIGKLEAKVSTAPTVRAPKAPAPISPVGGGSAAQVKNLASMSATEYYEARMKQRPSWAR